LILRKKRISSAHIIRLVEYNCITIIILVMGT
jgi:hypothetical protein